MLTQVKCLIISIMLFNVSAWGEIKSKEEIGLEAKAKVTHISPEQLSEYISKKDDFILLDVRTEAEYQAGHIQGATWFPRGRIDFYIQELIKEPDAKIVLYCRTGGRSALASLTMKEIGYTNIVDLDGGFRNWVSHGNSFFNLHGENTIKTYLKKE